MERMGWNRGWLASVGTAKGMGAGRGRVRAPAVQARAQVTGGGTPSKQTLPPNPPHTLTHTSARVENAFHKEVESTEMTTMATPLGGGFPITRAIDIAFCTIDCKGTWAAALLRPVVDFTMVAWGE